MVCCRYMFICQFSLGTVEFSKAGAISNSSLFPVPSIS